MRASRRRRFVPIVDFLGTRVVLSDLSGTGEPINPNPIVAPPGPNDAPPPPGFVSDLPTLPPDAPIVV